MKMHYLNEDVRLEKLPIIYSDELKTKIEEVIFYNKFEKEILDNWINELEGMTNWVVDFANVKFATRSFVDEYYNIIMKSQSSIKIETINIPEDIQIIFDVVQRTQHKEKDIKLDATVVKCKTFADLQQVFGTLLL